TRGVAMSVAGVSYFLAAGFWFLTALYGVLASQAFIQKQFLTPRLFDPLALFADWHSLISALVLAMWVAMRTWKTGRSNMTSTSVVAVVWLGVTAFLAVVTP